MEKRNLSIYSAVGNLFSYNKEENLIPITEKEIKKILNSDDLNYCIIEYADLKDLNFPKDLIDSYKEYNEIIKIYFTNPKEPEPWNYNFILSEFLNMEIYSSNIVFVASKEMTEDFSNTMPYEKFINIVGIFLKAVSVNYSKQISNQENDNTSPDAFSRSPKYGLSKVYLNGFKLKEIEDLKDIDNFWEKNFLEPTYNQSTGEKNYIIKYPHEFIFDDVKINNIVKDKSENNKSNGTLILGNGNITVIDDNTKIVNMYSFPLYSKTIADMREDFRKIEEKNMDIIKEAEKTKNTEKIRKIIKPIYQKYLKNYIN